MIWLGNYTKMEIVSLWSVPIVSPTKIVRSQMFQKPKRYTNDPYLEHVRCLPCCAPGCKQKNISEPNKGKVDPHHTRSVKAGGSDLTAIPLCREHHTKAHWSQVKFQEKYGIDFKEVQIECLQLYIMEKCDGN